MGNGLFGLEGKVCCKVCSRIPLLSRLRGQKGVGVWPRVLVSDGSGELAPVKGPPIAFLVVISQT